MASINDKLGQALEFHSGNFAKQMDGLETSHQALSVKSFTKLEHETRALLNTFNYAKHFETGANEKYENMQNILNQILVITQAEPESHKKHFNDIDSKMLMVQNKMNVEIFEQEVVKHMHDRTREESDLVKEKVKELIKVMNELDKRHNQARLIENHARNSKEEAEKEMEELRQELNAQVENHQKIKRKLESKQSDLESAIKKKKDTKEQRIKSESVIKERAERLKKSIEKLKERERQFNMIKQKQKEDQIKFEQQFEKIKARFKTEKPDLINQRFIRRTLKKQSNTNYFNDITQNLYELWIYKEELVKQKDSIIQENNNKLQQNKQLMQEKAEFQHSILENKILLQKNRAAKLKDLVSQKQEIVYSAIIGLKLIFDKIKQQQEIVASAETFKKDFVVADVRYPDTIRLISQISLITDKKFGFLLQFKEQDLNYRMNELHNKHYIGGFAVNPELQVIHYKGLPFNELVELKKQYDEAADRGKEKQNNQDVDDFGSPNGSDGHFYNGNSDDPDSDEHDSLIDGSDQPSDESQGITKTMSKQQTVHGAKQSQDDKSMAGGGRLVRSLSQLQCSIQNYKDIEHPELNNNMPFFNDLDGAEDFIVDLMQPAHDAIDNQEAATNESYEENQHIQTEAQILKKQIPSGQKQPRESTFLSSILGSESDMANKVMTKEERVRTFEAAAKSGFVNKGINDANFVKMIYETNKKFKEVDNQIDRLKAHGLSSQSSTAVRRKTTGSRSSSDLAALLDPSRSGVFSRQQLIQQQQSGSSSQMKQNPWSASQHFRSALSPPGNLSQLQLLRSGTSHGQKSIFKSPIPQQRYQSQQNLFLPRRANNGMTVDSSKLRLQIKDMLQKVDTNKLGNHVSRDRMKTIKNILDS